MKKYVSAIMFFSLLALSGCNSETNETSKFQNEREHVSENFVTEEQVLKKLPQNTWYFSLQNSNEMVDHFQKTYITSIRKIEEYLSGEELKNVAATEVIAVLALEQIKTLKNVQILLSASGDKISQGEFPSWYSLNAKDLVEKKNPTEEERIEAFQYFNTENCIKIQAEINNPYVKTEFDTLKNSFEEWKNLNEHTKELTLILEYNKDTNIYNFQAGVCKNIPNFSDIKIDKSFVFATTVDGNSPLFTAQFNKMTELLEYAMQKEMKNAVAGDKIISKAIFDASKIFMSEILKYNAIKISHAVSRKISTVDITTDVIEFLQIVDIPADNERNILKEYMLGEALQYPYSGQDFIQYSFSFHEENKKLYFSDTVSNFDEYYFPKKILQIISKTYFFFLF